MSKISHILFVSILLSLFLAATVFTASAQEGGCPPGFDLHMAHDHDHHEGEHFHAGTDADQNGDGFICVKPVTPDKGVHVHIDNNVKLGLYK